MNLLFPKRMQERFAKANRPPAAAFTMVEIALSLAILGFALVAIIGVLPLGIKVQKENRDETIITQDGLFLMEAIRSGAQGLDVLTNHVERIFTSTDRTTNQTVAALGPRLPDFNNGAQIIGLLSRPKYLYAEGRITTNFITAHIRGINGSAIDLDPGNRDLTFRYLLTSEIIPLSVLPREMTNSNAAGLSPDASRALAENFRRARNLEENFYEIRLKIQWPLFRVGNNWETGNGVKTFRSMVAGRLILTNQLYRFQPGAFAPARS